MEIPSVLPSPRLKLWLAYLVFSVIVMTSSLENRGEEEFFSSRSKSNQNWAIACSIITLIVTATIVGMHFHSTYSSLIVGTKAEGYIILVLFIFWIALVAVISDPVTGLAVDEDGAVFFGNLYYFTWMGFMTSIFLIAEFLQGVFNIDVRSELTNGAPRLSYWVAFMVTSIIVMGTSADTYDKKCDSEDLYPVLCFRSLLSVVFSCICVIISLGVVILKISTGEAPFLLEAGLGALMFVLYGVAVPFITSEKGPGSALGNLYYFSWISFFLAFIISSSCYEDFQALLAASENEAGESEDYNTSALEEQEDQKSEQEIEHGEAHDHKATDTKEKENKVVMDDI